eukprot:UN24155
MSDDDSSDEGEMPAYMEGIKTLDEGEETCGVCCDGESYEENKILYCDGCDVACHQHCYGVKKIPDDDWYCKACQAHIDYINPPGSRKKKICQPKIHSGV